MVSPIVKQTPALNHTENASVCTPDKEAAAGVVLVPGLLGVTSSLTVMLIILSSHTTRRQLPRVYR